MKKETFEEAAIRLYPDNIVKLGNETSYNAALLKRKDFIDGFKLAQEQNKNLYSEEEVLLLLQTFNKHTLQLQKLKLGNSFNVKDWFEQVKK